MQPLHPCAPHRMNNTLFLFEIRCNTLALVLSTRAFETALFGLVSGQ